MQHLELANAAAPALGSHRIAVAADFCHCDMRGQCDVLLRADDIAHDDNSPVKAEIIRKAFRGSEFLCTLRLKDGQLLMAHVPSQLDHKLGEWMAIKAVVDHVVTLARQAQGT